jgi:hypothetical protein
VVIQYAGRTHATGENHFSYTLDVAWNPTSERCFRADAALNHLTDVGWTAQGMLAGSPSARTQFVEPFPNTEEFKSNWGSEAVYVGWVPRDNPNSLQNVHPSLGCLTSFRVSDQRSDTQERAGGAGQSEVADALPDQATTRGIWRRALALLRLPHGLVTIDDVGRAFGGQLEYISKDSSGYTARSENARSKNYAILLVYLYQPLGGKGLEGPESTLDISLPACLDLDRAAQDLLHQGMRFSGEEWLPASPGKIYTYADGNGSVELVHGVASTHSSSDRASMCVKTLVVRGYVRSS